MITKVGHGLVMKVLLTQTKNQQLLADRKGIDITFPFFDGPQVVELLRRTLGGLCFLLIVVVVIVVVYLSWLGFTELT